MAPTTLQLQLFAVKKNMQILPMLILTDKVLGLKGFTLESPFTQNVIFGDKFKNLNVTKG